MSCAVYVPLSWLTLYRSLETPTHLLCPTSQGQYGCLCQVRPASLGNCTQYIYNKHVFGGTGVVWGNVDQIHYLSSEGTLVCYCDPITVTRSNSRKNFGWFTA